MKILFQPTWILPMILACTARCSADLDVLHTWKYIDYVWDNDTQKEDAVASGQYNATKIAINDVQQLPDGRVLVTTPKYFDNPASLSVISNTSGDGGPLLEPYPSWSWHTTDGNSSSITSVNRVRVDQCNRLWIVDSGKIGNDQVSPARILIFDPATDELLERIEIPDELSHNPNDTSKGKLELQAVETEGDTCEKTWVYIGDLEGWGLLIYNGSDIWRIDNDELFAPQEEYTTFSLNDKNVTLNTGVASMLILPDGFFREKSTIFKPMASEVGYGASVEDLHNSFSGNEVRYYKTNFTAPSQELARDISSDGILIAGFPTVSVLVCWNIEWPLLDANVVTLQTSDEYLQFVSGVKITNGIQSGVEGDNVWVASIHLQQFISDSLDITEDNYYILGGNVKTLVNGTKCQTGPRTLVDDLNDKFFFSYSP
ncbi:major royal jelly protein 1-like [Neodiprion pinetum]|uniref:major royal jelly protein 1-like n=1 Tax=Neodiprion pinetum TaxID=441929 RepID=UPI001EDD3E5A|nr:major royal jelly protein 1-like [Neodiprion pinetum]XP_046467782.1 major royal jelly protein 1-like [Neodiprion pinetum]